MKERLWAVLACLVLFSSACGGAPTPISGTAGTPTGMGVTDWPDTETSNTDCVIAYPKDLQEQPHAVDGTIEEVEIGEYSEDAGSAPVTLRVRVNELFRGEDIQDEVALRTWDFMLPEKDVTGTRILAATSYSLDLQGCGYTRPFSEVEASKWRRAFAKVAPVECGKEVRDCDLGHNLSAPPAKCDRASQEAAIAFNIDGGGYPFEVLGCNEDYMSLRIDLGADDCPPEATEQERKDCADPNTAYFVAQDGTWDLINYEERTDCAYVQDLEPSFPTAFCEPR